MTEETVVSKKGYLGIQSIIPRKFQRDSKGKDEKLEVCSDTNTLLGNKFVVPTKEI